MGALPALGLGTLEQAGVVEGDRGQLGEPRQGLELALAERPAAVAGREPDHAQHLAVRGQRHRAHRAERLGVEPARRVRVGAVVVDVHRPARPDHRPADPGPVGQAIAVEPVEQPTPTRHDELLAAVVVLEQVQEAALDADQARGAVDDLPQQLAGLEPLQQAERHLVDRREVRVAGRVVHAEAEAVGRLGEVQRPVGDRDEVVLLGRVVGVERRAGADRRRSGRSPGSAARPRPGPARSPRAPPRPRCPAAGPRTRRRRSGRRGPRRAARPPSRSRSAPAARRPRGGRAGRCRP